MFIYNKYSMKCLHHRLLFIFLGFLFKATWDWDSWAGISFLNATVRNKEDSPVNGSLAMDPISHLCSGVSPMKKEYPEGLIWKELPAKVQGFGFLVILSLFPSVSSHLKTVIHMATIPISKHFTTLFLWICP